MVNCCGLLTATKEPVPLKSVDVEVTVRDHVATVAATLLYENKEQSPIEAVFVFPLPGDAAVCHFSAKIGQSEVVAEVREKQKAREEYDDALTRGQQAFLLEESEKSPDVFSLSVGSLPPGESASIRLEYVTELAVQADDGLRFCLPAVLNPRYQPLGSDGGAGTISFGPGTSVPASLVPYSLSLCASVCSPRPITKVESNCSLDPVQYLNQQQTQAAVKLAAGHKFDRDVELLLYYKDSHLPTAVVEAGCASAKPGSLMGDPVVMVSLYPEFPPAVMSLMTKSGEFLFVIDRSGSMSSPMSNADSSQIRIDSAKETLLLLLKSLPIGCYFNIYSFGSSYTHIFPQSVVYSQQTMDEALKVIEDLRADMGGTEILEPLKHIFKQPCIPSQPRQLFVFTDGEVSNTKAVIDVVKRNSGSHRCFSFGIGGGASTALINGLAKEGRGHAQFIAGADRMQSKVMQSLRFALQPAVVDISVTWDVPAGVSVTTLTPPITNLFQGQRSLIYAQLTGEGSGDAEGCVTVKYSLAEHPTQNQLNFSLKPTEDTGLTAHRLGARTLIRSLEVEANEPGVLSDQVKAKEKVVEVSVQSGVSSSLTAFIAVNKGNGEALQGPLLRRNVPAPRMKMGRISGRMAQMAMPIIGCSSAMAPDMALSANRVPMPSKGLFCKKKKVLAGSNIMAHSLCAGMVEMDSADYEDPQDLAIPAPRDPMLQLISLQRASGSWLLESALAAVFGRTLKDVEGATPVSVSPEVWATVLAVIWLHGFNNDAQEEWEFLAMKAVSWLHGEKVPCMTECVEAGNVLLGCQVQESSMGISFLDV
uniref:von Willebrand factor A domain-containing protein 5A-like n=1 Tax=Gadus morhua TaxID=8049 RepID=A0A8C4YX55_GADMO